MSFNRLRHKCSEWTRAVLYTIHLENFLYIKKQKRDVVLMFHNVLEKTNSDLNMRNIGAREFEFILQYLKRRFEIVSLDEIVNSKSTQSRLAITFDDGLVNNLHHALPVLERLQIPATIYVSTSWLSGRSELWPDRLSRLLLRVKGDVHFRNRVFFRRYKNLFVDKINGERLENCLLCFDIDVIENFLQDLELQTGYNPSHDLSLEDEWRVMKGEEIKIIAASPYVSIGSHGVTHVHFCYADDDLLHDELTESKSYLEQIIGKQITDIAFPFGGYNERVVLAASRLGYQKFVAVDHRNVGIEDQYNFVYRHGIYNDVSAIESLHKINSLFL